MLEASAHVVWCGASVAPAVLQLGPVLSGAYCCPGMHVGPRAATCTSGQVRSLCPHEGTIRDARGGSLMMRALHGAACPAGLPRLHELACCSAVVPASR